METTKEIYRLGIKSIYEEILRNKGIHVKLMTEASFKILYKRYKELKGRKEFLFEENDERRK